MRIYYNTFIVGFSLVLLVLNTWIRFLTKYCFQLIKVLALENVARFRQNIVFVLYYDCAVIANDSSGNFYSFGLERACVVHARVKMW